MIITVCLSWQLILWNAAHVYKYTMSTLEGVECSRGRISILDFEHLQSELVIQTPVITTQEK